MHRFHQLLRQLFSADSILQLVSPNAIEPLSRFGSSDPPTSPDDELGPQVPAFGMLFKNLDSRVLVRPDHLIATNLQHYATATREVDLRLRRLAALMARRAKNVYENLVNSRLVLRMPDDNSLVSNNEWQETGCNYGRRGNSPHCTPFSMSFLSKCAFLLPPSP